MNFIDTPQAKELADELNVKFLFSEADALQCCTSIDEFITILQGKKVMIERAIDLAVMSRMKYHPDI